jgi:hypothetical protein
MKRNAIPFGWKAALCIAALWTGMVARSYAHYDYFFVALDDTNAVGSDAYGNSGTFVRGISGSNMVGYYIGAGGVAHGFEFDGTSFTTLDDPLATGVNRAGNSGTYAIGISGSEIVGYYIAAGGTTYGFEYNGTSYITLTNTAATGVDKYGNSGTFATGVSDNNVVGSYIDGSGITHGFIYNGVSYATLNDPPVTGTNVYQGPGTFATGISGQSVVGYYLDSSGHHNGFSFDNGGYMTVNDPHADTAFAGGGTTLLGVSRENLVGYFTGSTGKPTGFVYNGYSYNPIEDPVGPAGTVACGVSGLDVAGYCLGANGVAHGFIAHPILHGQYTLLLSSTAGPPLPFGPGYATLKVGSRGTSVLTGKLPDGESFQTISGLMPAVAGNQLIISGSLIYPSPVPATAVGMLSGTLTFESLPGSDLDGTLYWTKPAQRTGLYRSAFVNTPLAVVGSIYIPPRNGGDLLFGYHDGTLEMSDTNGTAASATVSLTVRNTLHVSNDGAYDVQITANAANGVFKGTFIYSGKKPVVDYQGVLYQDQAIGEGLFLGPHGSGLVTFTPSP